MAARPMPALPSVVGRVPVSVGGLGGFDDMGAPGATFTNNTAASSGIEEEEMSAFTGAGELTIDDSESELPPLRAVNAKDLWGGVTDFASMFRLSGACSAR